MKMSQTTRILLLLVLIVAAVAVWYALFFTGGQQEATPAVVTIPRHKTTAATQENKPVAVTTSARALQVLPIPFLVTEAPEEAPLETGQQAKTPAIAEAAVPPNPFVPLRIKTAVPPQKPQEVPESKKPVLVTPQPELTANIPVPKTMTPNEGATTPPPVSLGQGALPIKLSPLAQEVTGVEPLQQAVAETNPPEPEKQEDSEAPANDNQNPVTNNGSEEEQKPASGEAAEPPSPSPPGPEKQEDSEAPANENQNPVTNNGSEEEQKPASGEAAEPPPPPPPNPLAEWAAQENLRLDGVALGPVGVAIFKTASGYLALPVGQTFPDKNVLVKTITAERVLLVDSSGNNTLTLELGGGE